MASEIGASGGQSQSSLAVVGIELDAHDPALLSTFWAGVLTSTVDQSQAALLVNSDEGRGYRIVVREADTAKPGQNRIHLDLTSASPHQMRQTIERALDLGARRIDIGQAADDLHEVLADPEGNEFCVCEPGNGFLAGTGTIGAINCDGTRALGHFWSRALGWPLVWDQNEETAIQAPNGGSKITWSGPPLMPRHGRDRVRLLLAAVGGASFDSAEQHLLKAGARRGLWPHGRPTGPDPTVITMLDLDGNEFTVRRA